jgi:hypothetical protein
MTMATPAPPYGQASRSVSPERAERLRQDCIVVLDLVARRLPRHDLVRAEIDALVRLLRDEGRPFVKTVGPATMALREAADAVDKAQAALASLSKSLKADLPNIPMAADLRRAARSLAGVPTLEQVMGTLVMARQAVANSWEADEIDRFLRDSEGNHDF